MKQCSRRNISSWRYGMYNCVTTCKSKKRTPKVGSETSKTGHHRPAVLPPYRSGSCLARDQAPVALLVVQCHNRIDANGSTCRNQTRGSCQDDEHSSGGQKRYWIG